MFGAAMVVAAVVAAAEAGPVVRGEMGVVLEKPSTTTTTSTATATSPVPAAAADAAAGPAAGPAPTATPATSTITVPTAAPAPAAAADAAPAAAADAAPAAAAAAPPTAPAPPPPAPPAPAEEDSAGKAPAPAPAAAPLGAAPSGGPLADSVPVVIARRTWSDGGATERIIEPSGDLVLHVVSPAGTVLSCTKVGSLYTLPIESQTDAAYGEVVHLVRDDSGALIRYVVQADGEPRAVTVLEPARLSMQ